MPEVIDHCVDASPLDDVAIRMLLEVRPKGLASPLPTTAVKMWSTGDGVAEMRLYGIIGKEITSAGVAEALAEAPYAERLDIRISSNGGDIIEGWVIYNALARHPAAQKIVTIEGLAASMATIIAMVGTEIVIPSNSYMMIHNPIGAAIGGPEDMRRMADFIDHMRGVAVGTYARRTGLTTDRVSELMDAETYMSAEQALLLGFADRIETTPYSDTGRTDAPMVMRSQSGDVKDPDLAVVAKDIDTVGIYARLNAASPRGRYPKIQAVLSQKA
jgi:ATP-dependent Clp protease protease subunit